MSQLPGELAALWRALATAMQAAGIGFDTKLPLTPHVTVLRDTDVVLPMTPISPAVWQVDEFVLIHSHLGAQSHYTVLGRWPLPQRNLAAGNAEPTAR